MKILDNYSLIDNNTFKIDVRALRFIEYYEDKDIIDFTKSNPEIFKSEFLVIGEGSNILFTGDYNGCIIHPATKGISVVSEDSEHCLVEVSAGVIMDDFIVWAINNSIFGLENLSGIPGTVGASAVQNVGAYGAEAGDHISEVKFLNLENFEIGILNNEECKFGYRNSIFKNELKGKTIVLSVTYRLNKGFIPNLSYIDVKNYFSDHIDDNVTAFSVRKAVIEIRNRKLPDYKVFGNAGSFFKNPVIDEQKFEELKNKFPDIKYFPHSENKFKIAAGWMIDRCNLKGFEYNGAAVDEKQALVLINKNGATGKSVMELSGILSKIVFDEFGVLLEPEVLIV
ncbi:MAG: UDP-N-acetylmuramate dehydrogenase [Bacteroidales bacterium]|jgi:UDP-N-acetylmuramate dehydrogenase|nr:UDP-N-acetylmuramate dehydrogenase [Bacteroidales bacterium]